MATNYNFKKANNITFIDKVLLSPAQRFMSNSSMSGIVLFCAAALAFILANSAYSDAYHHIWEHKLSIGYDNWRIEKELHHWINDGLMAVFFFVVGLELKREIVAGELRDPKKAVVPIIGAIGGMAIPALVYLFFTKDTNFTFGWGVPMATDIAFALGVVYLLGDKVPLSVKVFLTALAIVDDLGAVLVIALFYTSDLNFLSLGTGIVVLFIMISANIAGVRNTVFYGILGIGGLWLAFLMSGVHATIAAVLAAFTIPATVKVNETEYIQGMNELLNRFKKENPNNVSTVTENQLYLLEDIRRYSKKALTPLQSLELSLHPLVAFVIMPIFALANAGVVVSGGLKETILHPVFLGVFFGLLVGKILGVFGLVSVFRYFKIIVLPEGMTGKHLLGTAFLAAIGFTMSLFIVGLAFKIPEEAKIAKMAVLSVTVFASIIGFLILLNASSKNKSKLSPKSIASPLN